MKRLEDAEEIILIEPAKNAPSEFQLESRIGLFYPTALDEDKDGIREGTIFYDPYTTFWLKCGGKIIPPPPDVVLAHEMGHAYGLDNPPSDQDHLTGTCTDNFENPYRKEKGLPERPCYGCERVKPPTPKPEKPKAPRPKR